MSLLRIVNSPENKERVMQLAEILKLPVSARKGEPSLRSVCLELGIEYVLQDGEEVDVRSARDYALQAALIEQMKVEPVEPSDIEGMAQRYWDKLRKYAVSLFHADMEGDVVVKAPYYHPYDGKLPGLALEIATEIKNRPSEQSETGFIGDNTVRNLKSKLKAETRRVMEADSSPEMQAHREHVERIFDLMFGWLEAEGSTRKYKFGMLDQALGTSSRAKAQKDNASKLDRKQNPSTVRVAGLYRWANDTLADYSRKNFKDVSLALQLVTGRRPSEIHATARFEPAGKPDWVLFSGQLKTKGREDAPASYEIPVFAPPHLIIEALSWLGQENKRVAETYGNSVEDRAKKANDTWSSDLNKHAKTIDKVYLDYEVRGERIVKEKKKPMELTCNGCRDIYAQVVLHHYLGGKNRLLELGKVLGHRLGDSGTTERYDIDYIVQDADLVKKVTDNG